LDVALCLADISGELSAALADSIRLEEAAMTRANLAAARNAARRLSRAR
jgi:hypothetical protein